ncbi:MAG: DNA polymerase III subunit delta [Prevotella sp.]|nr:DNA polymerase III subunit delta [Prevotella sp.]
MKFEEVIGQSEVKERMLQMVREDRVPHAMLLCGPSGSGKLALATAFACHLIAESTRRPSLMGMETDPQAEAMLAKLEHPDLHFSYPTIKTSSMGSEHQPVSDDFARQWRELLVQSAYISMDQWMSAMDATNQQAIITAAESDELSRKLSLKSSQGGYKVSVIWLPERMNQSSANKLLKLLEEPPQQTVFIMVSEEPERLLETIRSRTQRISVKRLPAEVIEEALVQRRGIEQDDAHRISRVANGSWPSALNALDADSENAQFFELFTTLMRLAYQQKLVELKQWVDDVAALGREKQKRLQTYFLLQVRENFMYNFHEPELNYQTKEEENFSRNFSRFVNEANVMEISELFQRVMRDIGQNANGKIAFFDMALQIIILLKKR